MIEHEGLERRADFLGLVVVEVMGAEDLLAVEAIAAVLIGDPRVCAYGHLEAPTVKMS